MNTTQNLSSHQLHTTLAETMTKQDANKLAEMAYRNGIAYHGDMTIRYTVLDDEATYIVTLPKSF